MATQHKSCCDNAIQHHYKTEGQIKENWYYRPKTILTNILPSPKSALYSLHIKPVTGTSQKQCICESKYFSSHQ